MGFIMTFLYMYIKYFDHIPPHTHHFLLSPPMVFLIEIVIFLLDHSIGLFRDTNRSMGNFLVVISLKKICPSLGHTKAPPDLMT